MRQCSLSQALHKNIAQQPLCFSFARNSASNRFQFFKLIGPRFIIHMRHGVSTLGSRPNVACRRGRDPCLARGWGRGCSFTVWFSATHLDWMTCSTFSTKAEHGLHLSASVTSFPSRTGTRPNKGMAGILQCEEEE